MGRVNEDICIYSGGCVNTVVNKPGTIKFGLLNKNDNEGQGQSDVVLHISFLVTPTSFTDMVIPSEVGVEISYLFLNFWEVPWNYPFGKNTFLPPKPEEI